MSVPRSETILTTTRLAIWNRHPVAVALSAAAILTQVALLVYSVVVARDNWEDGSPLVEGCVRVNLVQAGLPALATTFTIDALLLLLMLFGLCRRREARRFGLGGFLLKQGLVWLALATMAELPTVVRRSNSSAVQSGSKADCSSDNT